MFNQEATKRKSKQFNSQLQIPNISNYLHKLSGLSVRVSLYTLNKNWYKSMNEMNDELRMQFDEFSLIFWGRLNRIFWSICLNLPKKEKENNTKNC